MKKPSGTLADEVVNARRGADIVDRLGRYLWQRDNSGEPCPPDRIPTEADLAEWLPHCPPEALAETAGRAARCLPPPGADKFPPQVAPWEPWRWCVFPGGRLWLSRTAEDMAVDVYELECVHAAWAGLPDGERPPHSLGPIVQAWQRRPRKVEPDEREAAIMPGPLFAWAGGAGGSPAPAVLTLAPHDNELPIALGSVEPEPTLFLPGLEPPESEIVPAPALVLVEEAGFGSLTGGSGARLDKRLLVYSLLAVEYSERRPGGSYTLYPTLKKLARTFLWPPPCSTGTGESNRSTWKPSRHGPMLRRAMNAVTLAGVKLPDGRTTRPVMFRTLPDFNDLDSKAVIEIKLPDIDGHGPEVHRGNLIAAGAVSDPAFDAWLTLATLWDRVKAKNGGFRIYATRPKALRDPRGRLTRADGSLILGHAQNPFSAGKGRLKWKLGHAPQRNWQHPEAVIVGEERHPFADRVPLLDRNDRRRLFHGHRSDTLTASGRSRAADRAEGCLREWEQLGRVVIEYEHGGWRILQPHP